MIDLHNALIAGRMIGGSGGTPPPEPVLIEKTITENGTYNASADDVDGYSSVVVNVPESVLIAMRPIASGTSANYGNNGEKVLSALEIDDETTLNTRMSEGWNGTGACYYNYEYRKGAYGGYIWNSPIVISRAKFWLGRYSEQNIALTATVQTRDANGNWNDIEDLTIATNLPYPLNVFECNLSSTPIYGVRWYHYKNPEKSSNNNITFFGMKLYL